MPPCRSATPFGAASHIKHRHGADRRSRPAAPLHRQADEGELAAAEQRFEIAQALDMGDVEVEAGLVDEGSSPCPPVPAASNRCRNARRPAAPAIRWRRHSRRNCRLNIPCGGMCARGDRCRAARCRPSAPARRLSRRVAVPQQLCLEWRCAHGHAAKAQRPRAPDEQDRCRRHTAPAQSGTGGLPCGSPAVRCQSAWRPLYRCWPGAYDKAVATSSRETTPRNLTPSSRPSVLLIVRFHDVVPPQTRTFPECPESIETQSFVVSQGNSRSRTLSDAGSSTVKRPELAGSCLSPLERAASQSRHCDRSTFWLLSTPTRS